MGESSPNKNLPDDTRLDRFEIVIITYDSEKIVLFGIANPGLELANAF